MEQKTEWKEEEKYKTSAHNILMLKHQRQTHQNIKFLSHLRSQKSQVPSYRNEEGHSQIQKAMPPSDEESNEIHNGTNGQNEISGSLKNFNKKLRVWLNQLHKQWHQILQLLSAREQV